jgi:hypothetical protein
MDIITRLEVARNQTLRYFDLSDQQLDPNYGSGKWSVRFILHHLADAETVIRPDPPGSSANPDKCFGRLIRMRGQRDSTTHGCRSICLAEYTMQSGLGSYIRLVCTMT